MFETNRARLAVRAGLALALAGAVAVPTGAAFAAGSAAADAAGQAAAQQAEQKASDTALTYAGDIAAGKAGKQTDAKASGSLTASADEQEDGDSIIIVQLDTDKVALPFGDSLFSNNDETRHDVVKAQIANVLAGKQADEGFQLFSDRSAADSVETVRDYYHAIDGFAIKAPASALDDIKQVEGVKRAFVNREYSIPVDQGEQPALKNQSSLDMTAADKVSQKGDGQVIAIIDSGLDTDHEAFKGDLDDSKVAVTKADAEADIKELGHGAYISEKIPYVYDEVDGDNDVHPSSIEGMEHGTHVAGIAAANSGDQIRGTAPNAQLMMLKVAADSSGAIPDYALLAALDDATKLGVDSVNMSLGVDAGFSDDDTYSDALDALRATGATVNVAAGNATTSALGNKSGQSLAYLTDPDNSVISSPASITDAFAVASIDNAERSPYFTAADGTKVAYLNASMIDGTEAPQFSSLKDGAYEYFDGLTGSDSDLESLRGQYPSGVAGKIALVQRGGTNADGSNTTFAQKVNNMATLGAAAVIIYDNADGNPSSFGVDNKSIPAVMITKMNGEALKNAEDKTITVKQGETTEPSTAYSMSSFSSWGVTPDLKLKPEVTAPGGNIWSSIPNNQYEYMSGTSMATPQMAGIAAQLHEYVDGDAKFKGMSDAQKSDVVTQLLMSTAEPVIDPWNSDGAFYSPRWQSAGLANVEAATKTPVYLTVDGATDASRPKADLGESADGSWTFTVELHNLGSKDQTYTASSQALSSKISDDYSYFQMHDTNWAGQGIDVTYGGDAKSDGSVTVKAGKTAKVKVTVKAGADFADWVSMNAPNGTFVEGFTQLKAAGEDGVDLSVPYLGFYGDWGQAPIFDGTLWDTASVHAYGTTFANPNSGNSLGVNPLLDQATALAATPDPAKMVVSRTQYTSSPTAAYPLTGMLRNAQELKYEYVDAEGKTVRSYDVPQVSKSTYNSQTGGILYAEAKTGNNAAFDGKDNDGTPLPDGTYTLKQTGTVAGDGTAQENQGVAQAKIILDTVAPKISNYKIEGEGSAKTISFDVTDASYIAAIQLQHPTIGGYLYRQLDSDPALANAQVTQNEDGTRTWHVSLSVADIQKAWDEVENADGDESNNEPLPNSLPLAVFDYGLNAGQASAVLTPIAATGVSLSSTEVALAPGQTGSLTATALPANTTQTGIVWSSSDEKVVKVDERGNLTGVADGSATITAAVAENPSVKAEAKVTVADVSKADGIVMAAESAQVEPQGTVTVSAIVSPDLKGKDITWKSLDEKVATVKVDPKDSTKAVVTGGEQIGDTKIQAIVGGNKIATMKVAVRPANYDEFEIDANGKLLYYKGNAKDVVIPNNVKVIGKGAFQACPEETVFIPKSVEKIEAEAFQNGSRLKTVTFEEGSKLREVGDHAFYYNLLLDTVNLPDSVTKMGAGVFEQTTIRHASMAGMKEIPANTFASSPQLIDLTISDEVTKIGNGAFSASTGIGELKLKHADGSVTKGTALPSKLVEIGNSAFSGTIFPSIELPSGVKTVGDGAFTLMQGTVKLNDGLEKIGSNALAGTLTTEVVMPDSLTDVGYGAFSQMGSLKTATVGKNVKDGHLIAGFAYDNALTEIKMPEGGAKNYEAIDGVLYNKDKTVLTAFPLGKRVENNDYKMPAGTVKVADYAFAHAYTLTHVTFPESLREVGYSSFLEDKLTSVELPAKFETVGSNAFEGNAQLTSVDLGGTKKVLGYAFAYDQSIKDVDFGTRLESLGDGAFTYVNGLTELVFPDTLVSLGDMGFANMPNLEKVHLGAKMTSGLAMTFTGDPKLRELTVSPDNPVYHAVDNVLYGNLTYNEGDKDYYDTPMLSGKHLVLALPNNDYSATNGVYTVEPGTVQIDAQAFRQNFGEESTLKKVILPEGLKTIGTGAFNAASLDELVVPESVETVKNIVGTAGTLTVGPNVKVLESSAPRMVIKGAQGIDFVNDGYQDYANVSAYIGDGVKNVSFAASAPSVVVLDDEDLQSFSIEGMAFQANVDNGAATSAEEAVNALNIYLPKGSDKVDMVTESMRGKLQAMKDEIFDWAGKLPAEFDIDAWLAGHIHADYETLAVTTSVKDGAVTAVATGGTAGEKQFRFTQVNADGSETVLADWGSKATLDNVATGEAVRVDVRDSSQLTASAFAGADDLASVRVSTVNTVDANSNNVRVNVGAEGPTLTATTGDLPQDVKATYQWYKTGVDGATAKIDGATGEQYKLTSDDMKTAGEYRYYVVVKLEQGKSTVYVAGTPVTVRVAKKIDVDKSALKSVLDEAAKLLGQTGTYTADSLKKLQDAVNTAQKVYDSADAYEANVAAEVNRVRSAITALEKIKPQVDKTKLQGAYDTATALDQDAYTAESWSALTKAIDAAKAVLDNADASQAEVDTALTNLLTAQKGLVPVSADAADKRSLAALLTLAQREYLEGDYTPESWAPFAKAVQDASAVLYDDAATQQQADDAARTLSQAIAGLKNAEVAKGELQQAIGAAQALFEGDYTPESWKGFAAALKAAESVAGDKNATQQQVDDAAKALKDAQGKLVKKAVELADTKALDAAVNEAAALKEADYTPESWKVLASALGSAREVQAAKPGQAEQKMVDAAAANLRAALDALVKKGDAPKPEEGANVTELKAAVEAAGKLKEADYTPESWKVFQSAVASAQSVIDAAAKTPQSVADAALANLKAAQAGLEKVKAPVATVNKDALNQAIGAAEALSEDDYTAKSWEVLATALKGAKAVAASKEATQQQVDNAAAALKDAQGKLERKAPAHADTAAIDQAIAKAEALKEADYTPASWASLQAAVEQARAVKASGTADAALVEKAAKAVDTAVAALVKAPETKPGVDASKLSAAVAEAGKLKEADYTPESWKPFAAALKTARSVLAGAAGAGQDAVDAAASSLTAAQSALVKKADAPKPEGPADTAAIDEALKALDDLKEEAYTPASWSALQAAADSARAVKASGTTDAGMVSSAADALNKARAALVEAFTDVTGASEWVRDEGWLDYSLSHSLMTGYKDEKTGLPTGKFGPTDQISRGQVAVVLFRIANPADDSTSNADHYGKDTGFSDQGAYPYYRSAIKWLKDAGVLTGDLDAAGNPTNRVRPDDPITREELATMVYRFAKARGVEVKAADQSVLKRFKDGGEVLPFAWEAVAWSYEQGIMTGGKGADAGLLKPLDSAERGQAAKIFSVLHRDVLMLG